MKDKVLREQLGKVGIIDSDCYSPWRVQDVIKSGITEYGHNKLKAELQDLRAELDAMYKLLGVTRESAEDRLVKGKKEVAIKKPTKPIVWGL